MMASFLLYIFCFVFSACMIALAQRTSRKLFTIIGLATPILLVGLRQGVGTDYAAYVYMFNEFSQISLQNLITMPENSIELGFYAIIQLSWLLTRDYTLMFGASAMLTVCFAYLGIKRLVPRYLPIAFFLYLLVLMPSSMNLVRQGIAMSVIIFAISYIIRGNVYKYIACVLVAASFHTSALIMLPLYMLKLVGNIKKINVNTNLSIVIVITLCFGVLLPSLIASGSMNILLGDYANYEGMQVGIGLVTLFFAIILIPLVIIFYQPLGRKSETARLLGAMVFIEVALLGLSSVSGVFTRISYYFTFAGLLYITMIPNIINPKGAQVVAWILIALYGILYFTVTYYFAGYSNIFPYEGMAL